VDAARVIFRIKPRIRIVGWFSCGNNSAVMSKLLVDRYGNSPEHHLKIVRCVVRNEHTDNNRFHDDVQRWINFPIETRINEEFDGDCNAVWKKRRYMSGTKGAPCTGALKKEVRWALEKDWRPDFQAFGFSLDEKQRADEFANNNPDVRLIRILEERRISKLSCAMIVDGAGIDLPVLYKLGYSNNNCICCVKATSPGYWAKMRDDFPEVFSERAQLSRELGARLTRLNGKRAFIDEIPANYNYKRYFRQRGFECGLLCR